MTPTGWLQIALFTALVAVTVRPLGGYMKRVFSGEPTALGRALRPIERGIYRLCGIDPTAEQEWYVYALALLAFNVGVECGQLIFIAALLGGARLIHRIPRGQSLLVNVRRLL